MSRIARGAVTIVDIADGSNPIAAVLTNQNHTFAANSAGTVDALTRQEFSTKAIVYIGSTLATLSTDATLADNEYRIKPVGVGADDTRITTASSGTWAINVNASTGVLTVTAIDSTVATVSVEVVVEYKDPNQGSNGTIDLILTLTRVNEGAGGSVISMTPNKQVFFADAGGTLEASQDDIEMIIETAGSPGAQTYFTSQNGNPFVQKTATGSGAGDISGFDDDLIGSAQTGTIGTAAQRLFISQDNLGANDTLAVKVKGANGGVDVVTILKVRDGEQGAAAINVALSSSDSGLIFKNNSGTAKTLTVDVTDAANGNTLTPTNYQWLKNGAQINVTSSVDRTVVSSGGTAANGSAFVDITVGPEDVTDNGSDEFTCIVTVPD